MKRLYNSNYKELGLDDVIKWEVLPLKQNERLTITLVSTNSNNLQGIRIAVDNGCVDIICDNKSAKEFWFWENEYLNKKIELHLNGDGQISIYNVCYKTLNGPNGGGIRSLMDYSGMIVEELPDGSYKYKCNDLLRSTHFENLVFTVKIDNAV